MRREAGSWVDGWEEAAQGRRLLSGRQQLAVGPSADDGPGVACRQLLVGLQTCLIDSDCFRCAQVQRLLQAE
jgi:hypothetical protein